MPYFAVSRLKELRDRAVDAGIIQPEKRRFLLAGIHPRIVGRLPIVGSAEDQLFSDLIELNDIERLTDGSVPLAIWLENAEDAAKPRPQASSFATARQEVADKAYFRPVIAVPPTLYERQEIVIHQDDMLPVEFLAAGVEAGRSVAKVMVPRCENGVRKTMSSGEPVVGSGTGWLLTPALLITNHHVIGVRHPDERPPSQEDFNSQAIAAKAQFDFDADGAQGTVYEIAGLEACDKELDFAVVSLKQTTDRKGLQIAPEPLAKQQSDYAPVNIIQHPNARFKKIAIRNNLVTASTATELRYFTDTDSGSSGSPVFDDRWRVVALHRGATPVANVQYQGRDTAWVNFGSQIVAVLQKIQTDHAELWTRIKAGNPSLTS
jgi:V8-like Glu-specific endopeptidase